MSRWNLEQIFEFILQVVTKLASKVVYDLTIKANPEFLFLFF